MPAQTSPKLPLFSTVYRLAVPVAAASGALAFCAASLRIELHFLVLLLLSTVFVLLTHLFVKWRKSVIPYIIPPILVIIFLITARLLKLDIAAFAKGMTEWFTEYYSGGEAEFNLAYGLLAATAASVLISAAAYFICITYPVRCAVAVVFFMLAVIATVMKLAIPAFTVFCILFISATVLTELAGRMSAKRANRSHNREISLFLAPLCLACALGAALLPSKELPIQWTLVKSAYRTISNAVSDIIFEISTISGSQSGSFKVGLSESDEEKHLGGVLIYDDTLLLKYRPVSSIKNSFYMVGSVRNVYTGTGWSYDVTKADAQLMQYNVPALEYFYFTLRSEIPEEEVEDFFISRMGKVEYADLITKSLLYPEYSTAAVPSGKYEKNEIKTENVLYKRRRSETLSYKTEYLDINLRNPEFQRLVRQLDGFSYESDDSDITAKQLKTIAYNRISLDKIELPREGTANEFFASYSDAVKRNYLALPENMPARVGELAAEITADCTNNYDKLCALESYLATHYEYTRSPEAIPKGRDFADCFLFDMNSGYCTYYATSMAVMSRTLGIPSRYCEGVTLDYSEKLENNYYAIRSDSSHAWVECYIEGLGWLPFEPTASFYPVKYSEWMSSLPPTDWSGYNSYAGSYYPPQYAPAPVTPLPTAPVTEKKNTAPIILTALAVPLAVILITVAFYLLITFSKYRSRLRRMSINEQFGHYFKTAVFHLSSLGYPMKSSDTLLVYSNRAGEEYETITDMTERYMAQRYGGTDATDEDVKEVSGFCRSLSEKLRESKKPLPYIMHMLKMMSSVSFLQSAGQSTRRPSSDRSADAKPR